MIWRLQYMYVKDLWPGDKPFLGRWSTFECYVVNNDEDMETMIRSAPRALLRAGFRRIDTWRLHCRETGDTIQGELLTPDCEKAQPVE